MLNSSDPQAGAAPPTRRIEWLVPRQIALSLTAGAVAGLLDVGVLLSLAALIFSGGLDGLVANGIGLLLVGTCLLNIVLALLSSRPAIVGTVQDAPAIVMALIAANVAARLPAGTPSPVIYATVVVAIALTTLITGVTFLLLGQFRLGSLVRYLPYPVVGGFLAGTGWLLLLGGIGVMTGGAAELSTLLELFEPPALRQWLPGLIFGVLILLALRRSRHMLLLPGLLVGATALFYLWLALSGMPLAAAQSRGWLLGPFSTQPAWSPPTLGMLAAVQWPAILGQLNAIGAVVAISVISLLLNVSGLQLARREDIDLNQELRAAGGAQLAAGLLGAPPGFQSLSLSIIGHHVGAQTRLVGVVVGLISGAAFFFGAAILSFMPRVVLGGMVCYLGLAFLAEWLYDAWFRLSRLDYLLIALILALIAVFGILPGVIAGLLIAVIQFVVIYSRINVVKHTLSGAVVKSRMTRSYAEQELLRARGEQTAIFQLQGFLLFGTAHDLFERVRRRTLAADLPRLRFVLLDFRLVPRLDSTAMLSFGKMQQLAETHELTLVFTQLPPTIRRQIEQVLLHDQGAQNVYIFPDMDRGLEWCENQLLADAAPNGDGANTLYTQLARIVPDPADLAGMLAYFERCTIAPGEYLIHPNDPPDDMFFIESGQVTAQIELPGGGVLPDGKAAMRLETMRGGRVVGELGFYLGRRRTAAVVADEPCQVYRITRDMLRRMDDEQPAAASVFHLIITRLLSERAIHLIDTVDALRR
jgi:SulP family sulfate permease